MLPWSPGLNRPRIVSVSHDGRHRVDAARQRLAQHHDVRAHVVVLAGQHLAGAAQPDLDLVGDQQDLLAAAERLGELEVAVRRHVDAVLALDRLDQKGDRVGRHRVDQRVHIAEGHELEAGGERPEMLAGRLVSLEKLMIVVVRPWKLP